MPGLNLTRDEAQERSALLHVDRYDVELDLTTGPETFRSVTTVRFRVDEPASARTWLDLAAPTVREVVLNGEPLDPAEAFDGVRIGLPWLAADNEVRVVADCAYSSTGEGLHRFVDPVDGEAYCYTQFEVPDARRAFACFEQPDLKASFAFTVVAPEGWEVVSNAPTPEPEAAGDGAARWEFAPTPRLSTYVTAVVAGPYTALRDVYEGQHGSVPLGLFARRSLAEHLDADDLFTVTKQGFACFEEAFGVPYPFGKYDQLFVPEFNMGAMENAGAVTFRDEYLFRSRVTDAAYERRAETVLHELAHQWFGDLVTMRWWDDLWLNESFATWAAAFAQTRATRWPHAWATFANTEKLWALHQDQLPTTHPVAAEIRDLEDVSVNFDGITYAKGAAALKQLVAWVGEDAFLRGVRTYLERHAYGSTSLVDLFACLEETSGRDLEAWGEQWLRTAGVGTLRPEVSADRRGTLTQVVVHQEAPAAHPVLRAHRIAVGCYERDETDQLVRTRRVELDVVGERTEVAELAGQPQPDLLLLNDDDLTFAKVRLDDRSLATLVGGGIAALADPLPRALCWTAATDMLRDAEMPARRFVELVLGGIGSESELSVVQTLLVRTRTAVDLYTDPEARLAVAARWASGLRELALDSEPASDHQLALVRAWASTASSREHTRELGALLAGERALPGLDVDTDLRWHLVQCLVAVGAVGDAAIEEELSRDGTAAGLRQAATARALRPTAAAKEEAWRVAVEDPTTTNAIQESTLLGFAHPEQRALLLPFRDRYFAGIEEVWRTRTPEMAQQVVVRLYPRLLVEVTTLQRTDAWLDGRGADAPPALRRLVVEGRADIERALTAQVRDRDEGGFALPHLALPLADALRTG